MILSIIDEGLLFCPLKSIEMLAEEKQRLLLLSAVDEKIGRLLNSVEQFSLRHLLLYFLSLSLSADICSAMAEYQ